MSTPLLAVNTLIAFNNAVERDQGNAYRNWLGKVLPHIGDAYRADDAPFRSHMGASGIAKECARAVWYGFRWAKQSHFDGRMLRLFNRGHLEEGRFIALMLASGFEVIQQDAQGKQFKISDHGGHFGGSGDGLFYGCPDLAPGTLALSEYKTHGDKYFKQLAGDNWNKYVDWLKAGADPKYKVEFNGDGLRKAKFDHYVQMNVYMRKMGIGVGVYFAINKNDDSIYAEVVPLDIEVADQYIERAGKIIFLHEPPQKLNKSPSAFGCKFCDYRPTCHLGVPPARNCRSCEWVEPLPDGTWACNNKDRQMAMLFGPKEGVSREGENFFPDKQRQLEGCVHWAKNSKAF